MATNQDKFYISTKDNFFQTNKFTTINLDNSLRSSPEIQDTGSVIYDSNNGNIIAKYHSGSKGLVWAEQQDKLGQVWCFVEMNPVKKLKENLFYSKDNVVPRQIGWINKRFLKFDK